MAIDWDLVKILGCLLLCMVVWPDEALASEADSSTVQPPVFITADTAVVVSMVLNNSQEIHVGNKNYFRCTYNGKQAYTNAIRAEFTRTDGMECELYETITVKMTPVLPNL